MSVWLVDLLEIVSMDLIGNIHGKMMERLPFFVNPPKCGFPAGCPKKQFWYSMA